jgi:predicted acyl esterase
MRALLLVGLLLLGSFAGCLGGADVKTDQEPVRLQPRNKLTGGDVVEPGQYKFDMAFSQVLAQGPYNQKPPVRTLIKSAIDGVDIEIGYWLPDVPEGTKVPVLVHASPYHRPAGSVIQNSGTKAFLNHNFLPYGYAVAAIAVRGTADSGGCMELAGPKEIKDLSQAVTWLAEQPWSNGNVGMTGLSYDGSTPWEVAATGNPHLKTIVPNSGVNDFYTLMYKNGSAEIRAQVLSFLYYEYGWNVVTVAGGGSDPNRAPTKRVEGFLCPEAWAGLGASVYSFADGGRDPTGFWAARDLRPMVEKNYKGSILVVHGLEDWNVDPTQSQPWADQTLNMSGIPLHQVLGQWKHEPPDRKGTSPSSVASKHRMDYAEKLLDWFDYWLKDEKTIDLGPAVTVQDNTQRWRVEEHWPPRDANWTTYNLAASGVLRPDAAGAAGKVTLLPNPVGENPVQGNLRSTPGYEADFYTAPLEQTVNIAGLPRVHVTVTPHGAASHLSAWLYDVAPNGAEKRVGWTTMNLRFYKGGAAPQTLTPEQPIRAMMEIQPMDARIEAGHRIMLRLWQYSSDDHLGQPIAKDRYQGAPSAPLDVVFGGSTLSTVELPIVARPESDYFRPPMPEGFKYPFEQ